MNEREYSTASLWRQFMVLLNFVVLLALLFFAYLLLEDQIDDYINRPQYTEEQLEELSKRRAFKKRESEKDNWDLVKNGIHVRTGLKADPNLKLIIGSCTSCHSAKLITQNRATRQGWKNMIVWMQETQGLTKLGANEPIILDYLAKHYAPKEVGRRQNLDLKEVEWYILNLDDQ